MTFTVRTRSVVLSSLEAMKPKALVCPELLSPAGNFEKLCSAIHFGADAVYLAGRCFGMRAAADNFSDDDLKKAVLYVHSFNKKVYLTINVMPREFEFPQLKKYIELVGEICPDAVIVADLGVFSLCRQIIPHIPIHISTQAATVNSCSCRQWYEMGASRIVLARELSLEEIVKIKSAIPAELELEAFIHGSMCVSFSGRCMLSEYFTGRDANRGACTQPCRWQYRFSEEKRSEDVLTAEIYPEGSYIFGSKDLCMIDHIGELISSGIHSLKIEGRMKSAYYAAVTTNAYRIAIDGYLKKNEIALQDLHKELESVSHREYCTGYFFDKEMLHSNLATNSGYIGEQSFLCSVEDFDFENMTALCIQNNKFSVGASCEYISPGSAGNPIKILEMYDEKGMKISDCPHPKMKFKIRTDKKLKKGDLIRKAQ